MEGNGFAFFCLLSLFLNIHFYTILHHQGEEAYLAVNWRTLSRVPTDAGRCLFEPQLCPALKPEGQRKQFVHQSNHWLNDKVPQAQKTTAN